MTLSGDVYAEGRSSIQEELIPYVVQRIRSERAPPISEPRRFFQLLMGILACICASTSYVYNLYSGPMQQKYCFTQAQMSTITTVSSVIQVAALPLAGVYDHFGPKPLFAVGLSLFSFGAVLFGLAFADAIQGSVALFTFLSSCLGIATGVFDVAGLMTVMSIFPSSRGAVIAIMKTFIGLGAAIYGSIQLGFFEGDTSRLFYFMASTVAVFGFLCLLFLELPPYQLTGYEEAHLCEAEKRRRLSTKKVYFEQVPPVRRFAIGFAVVVALIIFLPVQSILVAYLSLDKTYKLGFAIATIAILSIYPLVALPLRCLDGGMPRALSSPEEHAFAADGVHIDGLPTAAVQRISAHLTQTRGSLTETAMFHVPVVDESEDILPQYQTRFSESVRTLHVWVFAYALLTISGTEGVIIVNARFLYAAVAERPISGPTATLLTVLNGVGSAMGRIAMSLFEVWLQRKPPAERVPITIALFIPTFLILIASSLLLFGPKEIIIFPFIFTAVGNGFLASVVVLVTRSLYAKDVAMHYRFMSIPSIVAFFLLNKFLYGGWYTKMAERQGGTLCFGRSCIFVPFLVMTILTFTGVLANLYVHFHYQSYCTSTLASCNRGGNHDPSLPVESVAAIVAGHVDPVVIPGERQPLLGSR